MKKTGTKTKVLLTLLVTLLVIGSIAVVSFAADKTASYDNKYGQIVPTDSKLEARRKSFTFYGDKANLYFMRISEGKNNANYAVEIYADKGYKDLIRSMSGEFSSSKGNTPLAIAWNFKNTPSGTYYGKCYTYISRDDGNVIDTDSIETFKIKIDRLSKKTVVLNSVRNSSSGVKITWSPITTATKYKVMRKAAGDKKWTTVETLGKGAYTFTDSSVKSGKTYTYTVRCYDGDYKSLYNKTGLKITYLAAPKLVDVQGTTSSGYAKFTWKAVSGAKSYEIYRKGGSLNSPEWKKIATVKGKNTVTYVDKKATRTDWHYSYSVRAVNGSNKSAYNTDGIDFNYMRAPLLKKAYSYTNGVRITWSDANDEVQKYYVYRKTSSGWKKLGSTTKKYYTDKTAKSGKSYTYIVKPVSKNNVGAYKSKGIKVNYLAMPKLGTVTFDSSNRAKITWSTVEGAQSYKILRKINSADEWKEIATVKGGTKKSYLDKITKKSGYTYEYTVKAIGKDATSYYNKTGIKNMFLSKPVAELSNVMSEDSNINIKITWKAIKGAEGYNVYRIAPGESDFICIAENIKSTSYYDTAVENNVKYRYAVRAVNGSAISRYTSVYIVALIRPIMESVEVTESGTVLTWSAVEGAESYYIYRKTADGKWETISSYSLNSFIDVSDEAKTTPFSYTVSAEAQGYKSDYDTVGMKNYVEITDITAQFNPATETELPYIMVDWTVDEAVESVEIFKSIGNDTVSLGVFDPVMTTQYEDRDIAVGTEYTYTAKAIKSGKLSTEKTASAKFPHAPLAEVEFELIPKYNEAGSSIAVTFAPVEFAEGYEIFRKASGEEAWKKLETISAEAVTEESFVFIDYDIDTEITYYYTVKAIASDRDSIHNETGKAVIVFVPVEPVAGIIAREDFVDGKTVAVITWDEVENGYYYKVLRKTADSEWEFLAYIFPGSDLEYIDDTIEQGVQYTYTVAVSAPGRGETINEIGIDFCWELPEEPTEPEVPPTTEPEVPPTTEPEVPPTTEPEVPPTTEPEVPPTTEPEVPPTTEPEVPPTTEPEVPPTTEPEVPPTTEPEVPPTTEPEVPPTTEPEVPPTTEPEVPPTTEPEVPPTTEPEVPPTTEPEVPPTTEPEVPPTTEPEVPPTTEPEVPPTTEPEVPPTTEPEVPPTTEPEVPPTTEPEVPPTTEPEVPPTTEPEVPPTTEPEVPPTTEPDVPPTTEPEEPTESEKPAEPVVSDGSEDVIIPDAPETPAAPADPDEPEGENPDESETEE